MADPIFRARPVYYAARQVGECHEIDYSINPNRAPIFGSTGIIGYAQGAVSSGTTLKFAVPVGGLSGFDFVRDCLKQGTVDIGHLDGTTIIVNTMVIMSYAVTSSTESGKVEGTMTLAGGLPTVT